MSSELFAPDNDNTHYIHPNFDALPLQQWPEQLHPHGNLRLVSEIPTTERFHLGDPTLPVAHYRDLFVNTVENNQYSVWSSETGSGKSSQFGLYLLEAGVPRVFITQPRILAARELFERAKHSLGLEYEHLAGYLTGSAADSDCGPQTRLIYITEQLLFKMANRGELLPGDAVVNDEAHERTVGTVALLGLMKEITQDDPTVKLLISSATIDTKKFSAYLLDPNTGKPAPIHILPGRTHPIKVEHTDEFVHDAAKRHMKNGFNVLGFEAGEARMRHTASQMSLRNKEHTVHVLYGDQSPTEQAAALTSEDKNHVVGTRVAETSITPQGKDAVADSGLSNIGLYEQGVKVLKTVFSSKATMKQRMGRVGRTKPGVYTVAVPVNAPEPPAYEDRDEYDIPAMETSSVASYINELLIKGRRLETMDLLERPTAENLTHDYRVLRRLGAIAVHGGEPILTEIGRAMADLPLDAALARMLVEARSIDTAYDVDTDAVRLQVAAIASIFQVNGILDARQGSERKYLLSNRKNDNVSVDQTSDLLFSLDTFVALRNKWEKFLASEPDKATARFEYYLKQKDIRVNRYYKAERSFIELCRREGLDPQDLTKPSDEERKAIIGCQIAGVDELFVQRTKTFHYDIRGDDKRTLGKRSTINPAIAKLVAGSAFDLRGLSAGGRFNKRFITAASVVSKEQLLQHAPHRITTKSLGYVVNKDGEFLERQALYFDGELQFYEDSVAPEPTIQAREFVIRAMMTGVTNIIAGERIRQGSYESQTPNASNAIKQWEKAQKLDHKSSANLMTSERYEKLIKKIVRDSVTKIPLEVTDPAALDEVIPPVFLNSLVRPTRKRDIPEILKRSPDAVSINVSEEEKVYLAVSYRNNVAYISVPRGQEYCITAADIANVVAHHPVKIRVGSETYSQSDSFFKQMNERMNAPKRLKRQERRIEQASHESTPETFALAVDRVKTARKRQPKPKEADVQNSSRVTQKRAYFHRRHSERSKEQVDQKTAFGK